MLRLVRLIEVQPEAMIAVLRGLLERTAVNQLRGSVHAARGERARRQLVWLAEKLAHFAEYFTDAEAILLRLAIAETEPHLGNNASRVVGGPVSHRPVRDADSVRRSASITRRAASDNGCCAAQPGSGSA